MHSLKNSAEKNGKISYKAKFHITFKSYNSFLLCKNIILPSHLHYSQKLLLLPPNCKLHHSTLFANCLVALPQNDAKSFLVTFGKGKNLLPFDSK